MNLCTRCTLSNYRYLNTYMSCLLYFYSGLNLAYPNGLYIFTQRGFTTIASWTITTIQQFDNLLPFLLLISTFLNPQNVILITTAINNFIHLVFTYNIVLGGIGDNNHNKCWYLTIYERTMICIAVLHLNICLMSNKTYLSIVSSHWRIQPFLKVGLNPG